MELSQDEAVKKYILPTLYKKQSEELNDKNEDEVLEFLNLTLVEPYAILSVQANKIAAEQNYLIHEKEKLVYRKKQEIMLEALFSRYYSLDIDKLVDDVNKVTHAKYYKQGELDKNYMRAFDRFNNWESYVEEKQ